MNKFEQYTKAISEIVAKPLFVLVGIAALIVSFGDFSIATDQLKSFALYFGGLCLILGLAQPMWTYAKAVWPKGKK